MLTNHQGGRMAFTREKLHCNAQNIYSGYEIYYIQLPSRLPATNKLNIFKSLTNGRAGVLPLTEKLVPSHERYVVWIWHGPCHSVPTRWGLGAVVAWIWNVRYHDWLVTDVHWSYMLRFAIKTASHDVGCISKQFWKEQCRMRAHITINRTKWYCSIIWICIKLIITIIVFTFVMPLNRAAIIGYM